eukprot:3111092-Pyramimonas_sp.AAC.1
MIPPSGDQCVCQLKFFPVDSHPVSYQGKSLSSNWGAGRGANTENKVSPLRPRRHMVMLPSLSSSSSCPPPPPPPPLPPLVPLPSSPSW